MKIIKQLRGEKFIYDVKLIPNSLKALVKYIMDDTTILCNITSDYKYIELPESFKHFINDTYVEVKKLKLSKQQQFKVKEYNTAWKI